MNHTILEIIIRRLKKYKEAFQYRLLVIFLKTFNKVIASFMSMMADTGIGIDECLEIDCLPLRVDFHSPIPDINDLKERNVWTRQSFLACISVKTDVV